MKYISKIISITILMIGFSLTSCEKWTEVENKEIDHNGGANTLSPEERDAHYRSVLSTRKHAVEGLELYVQAGSDDKAALEIADAVNEDIISHADCMDLIKNALDALGKGFSVNEII